VTCGVDSGFGGVQQLEIGESIAVGGESPTAEAGRCPPVRGTDRVGEIHPRVLRPPRYVEQPTLAGVVDGGNALDLGCRASFGVDTPKLTRIALGE